MSHASINPAAELSFAIDPATVAKVRAEILDGAKKLSPADASAATERLESLEPAIEFETLMQPLGLKANDLAHAMTGYWLSMWMIIHDKDWPETTKTQAVIAQARTQLNGNPMLRDANMRNLVGTGLVFETVLGWHSYANARDKAQEFELRKMRKSAAKNTAKRGVPLAKMRLTDKGLTGLPAAG